MHFLPSFEFETHLVLAFGENVRDAKNGVGTLNCWA
jgi:hypothetical protein